LVAGPLIACFPVFRTKLSGLLGATERTLVAMEPIRVRRLGTDDWRVWRDVRLAALAEAPDAFASTLARELAFGEEIWRGRMSGPGVHLMSFASRQPTGIAATFVPDPSPAPELVSMWVRPEWRSRQVGTALVSEVLAWACENGYGEVRLWVVEGNTAAVRLYENTGFVLTGQAQPHPTDPETTEVRMVHRLTGDA
jgi:GNAT superfamily N-acetyltransferase